MSIPSSAQNTGTSADKPSETPATPAIEPRAQPYIELDHRDEAQIIKEMEGGQLNEFVYSTRIQGKIVTSLAYAGTKEAIRRRGGVQILSHEITETETEIRAIVKMRDLINNLDVLGASSADKTQPFAFVLAVNKAERNAFNKLIPAKWYASLIEEYLKRQKGQVARAEPVKTDVSHIPQQVTVTPKEGEWHVSVDKNLPATEGLAQYPIAYKDNFVGQANLSHQHQEAALIPEARIEYDCGPIQYFLIPKVLDSMKRAHPEFDYRFDVEAGIVQALLVKPVDSEGSRLKELMDATAWAYAKAAETQDAN